MRCRQISRHWTLCCPLRSMVYVCFTSDHSRQPRRQGQGTLPLIRSSSAAALLAGHASQWQDSDLRNPLGLWTHKLTGRPQRPFPVIKTWREGRTAAKLEGMHAHDHGMIPAITEPQVLNTSRHYSEDRSQSTINRAATLLSRVLYRIHYPQNCRRAAPLRAQKNEERTGGREKGRENEE